MNITETKQVIAKWEGKNDDKETGMIMPPLVYCSWWEHAVKADLSVPHSYRSTSFTADELEQVAEMIYAMAKRMRQ